MDYRNPSSKETDRYRPVTIHNVHKHPRWQRMDIELREAVQVVSQVLPFRTNHYVIDNLIDWSRVPEDPIFQLVFPQAGMLDREDYVEVRDLLRRGASREEMSETVEAIRWKLNPHPAGQMTHNVPELEGRALTGLQHKYRETVLYFPGSGQTCHAYCTYCFRWAQFVGMPEIKFESREVDDLVSYLRVHPEVTDVLITGGDPMIMKTSVLRRHVEPLLAADLEHVRNIRIGTKAVAYWPQRFVSDSDADDLLRLFEEISAAGRHLSVMGHYSHPVEIETPQAKAAARRILGAGAAIRMQAPVIRHVNDDSDCWLSLWKQGLSLGMIPYYMFVERDTGPRAYFEMPLARAYEIFRSAYSRLPGLARTVRGPSMSAFPGKVRVVGIAEIEGRKVFVLDFLQARDPSWTRRPFFAKFDPQASWLDDLEPAFQGSFFFEPDEKAAWAAA